MNNMVINILVYISLWSWLHISMKSICISGTARSTGIYIFYLFLVGIFMLLSRRMSQILWSMYEYTLLCACPPRQDFTFPCFFVQFCESDAGEQIYHVNFSAFIEHILFPSFSWPFSSFKCSVYNYVDIPFVFCITNTFSKFIIYFWLWLWYQIS